jgi:biopolymer transport protein ExbD
MTDFLPKRRRRRHLKDIPLAPVLDLLTVVIFFLMLSTSFVELTKHTLPPASVSQLTDPQAKTPVSLKLFAVRKGGGYGLAFHWTGDSPGVERAQVAAGSDEKELRTFADGLSKKLKDKFPDEASVQLSMASNVNYQEMIAIMDGVREHFEDLVLIAPQEAESDAK